LKAGSRKGGAKLLLSLSLVSDRGSAGASPSRPEQLDDFVATF
jgi:hypothetical protein